MYLLKGECPLHKEDQVIAWAVELLAPGGFADTKVWEKLLTDVAERIVKADLGMISLGNFKFVYFNNNSYEDSIGFDVPADTGEGFVKVFGIYAEIDGEKIVPIGEPRADGSQPVEVKKKVWGLTKRGWVLIDIAFQAVEEGGDLYFVKAASHSGRYIALRELFRWESPKAIASVLDKQVKSWQEVYDAKASVSYNLREATREAFSFARVINYKHRKRPSVR
jgi:hypothetical protein